METELKKRGVQTSLFALLETASLSAIRRTIEWWDRQPDLGVGVLVGTLRAGGVTDQKRLLDRQREYGEQVEAWLAENFPELVRPREGVHPAARTAVYRLHYLHGRSLTKAKHGPEIRAAVRAFDEQWGITKADGGLTG